MNLFYTPDADGQNLILRGEEHTHCTKVLRYKEGSKIHATNGLGNAYDAVIKNIGKDRTICTVESITTSNLPNSAKSIAISPTKSPARIEWFVEKAVELGITEIYLFIGKRTEKKSINLERMNKIALSAMKQSLRYFLPKIHVCNSVKDLIKATNDYSDRYIAHLEDDTKNLTEIAKSMRRSIVFIGPEGDFTPDEIKLCLDNNFVAVSLGNARLRTETAGLAALMMLKD